MVLLDDMASTGRTLALAARLLLQAGATSVDVAVTHALIAGDALQALHDAGVGGCGARTAFRTRATPWP